MPSSNGFFTAGALGRIYGALSNSGALAATTESQEQQKLVSGETVAMVVESWKDKVMNRGATTQENSDFARRAIGFSPWVDRTVSPDPDEVCTLCHNGVGGCLALGEIETGLAIVVLKNTFEPVAVVGGSGVSPDVRDMVEVIKSNLFARMDDTSVAV